DPRAVGQARPRRRDHRRRPAVAARPGRDQGDAGVRPVARSRLHDDPPGHQRLVDHDRRDGASATGAGAIDPAVFRETLGHYPTGVAVATGIEPSGAPSGMRVGTFSSVSLDPPLVSFAPQRSSRTFAALRESTTFCVNVLAADQEELCRRMAAGGEDKFATIDWSPGPGGAPVLDGVVAWIECDWEQVVEAGDHYIVLGGVRDLAVPRAVAPLLFFQGGYGRFSSPSLMAGASPDLLEAVRLAEAIRADVEQCSAEVGATCAVLAKVAGDIVRSEEHTSEL